MHPKDPKGVIKGSRSVLPGDEFVFEAPISRDYTCNQPVLDFLCVQDCMISFTWPSCCAERAGSHINRVKTRELTLLGDVTRGIRERHCDWLNPTLWKLREF